MKHIQSYTHQAEGFTPLYLSSTWQVAQINYARNQAPGNIKSIDIHFETDELFVLLQGEAVLIGGMKNEAGIPDLEYQLMKPGIVYNIPKMTWHNIALKEGAQVLIFEDINSHLGKYEIIPLDEAMIEEVNAKVCQMLIS